MVGLALATAGCGAHRTTSKRTDDMNTEELAAQVQARLPQSLNTAARMGPAASETLGHLACHPDPEVRSQALICLRASGGPFAPSIALGALNDPDAAVVMHALQVLNTYPPVDDTGLLAAYPRHEEDRDQIALAAGRLGPKADVKAWKAHWRAAAPGTGLADALLAAVARMGDADARREFASRLEAARGHDVLPWMDRAVYQESSWVLPSLVKLLGRTERAAEVTPDDPSDLRPLRTCDLAANAILKITGGKVPFEAPRTSPYTDSQLAEFRRLAGP